jgi:hypothetical protein
MRGSGGASQPGVGATEILHIRTGAFAFYRVCLVAIALVPGSNAPSSTVW